MDLDKPVLFISKHATTIHTLVTHLSQDIDLLFNVTRRVLCTALSPELAYSKYGNMKEIHFQEIVVSGNVLQ